MRARVLCLLLLIGLGASAQVVVGGGRKIMIFGGKDHEVYLGCLSCSEYDADSVLNKFGEHGSTYSSESIWNPYEDYGSHYSDLGACNAYSSNPPVIVDDKGNYYGRLTLNRYHSEIGAGSQLLPWLKKTVCL